MDDYMIDVDYLEPAEDAGSGPGEPGEPGESADLTLTVREYEIDTAALFAKCREEKAARLEADAGNGPGEFVGESELVELPLALTRQEWSERLGVVLSVPQVLGLAARGVAKDVGVQKTGRPGRPATLWEALESEMRTMVGLHGSD